MAASSSSMAPAEILGTSAWVANKDEINNFCSSSDGTTSAAYIVGPHASGKSTTMLAFICSRVLRQTPDACLFYLVSTRTEASILRTYLQSEDFKARQEFEGVSSLKVGSLPNSGSLCLVSFALFCQSFDPRNPPSSRTVILLDAEIIPTTEGELAFGIVMHWATCQRKNEKRNGHAIAVLSPFFSKRTNDAIVKHVRQMKVITVQDRHKELNTKKFPAEWGDVARQLILGHIKSKEANTNRTLLIADSSLPTGIGTELGNVDMHNVHNFASMLEYCNAISIPPWVGFSTAYSGLRYIVSLGQTEWRCFDRHTSQIVKMARVLNQLELRKDYSWALKSPFSPENVTVYTVYSKKKAFERRPIGSDFAGDAYNGDILITVLRLIQQWPDLLVREMPIRAPDDMLAIVEAYSRLRRVGCIKETMPDRFQLTNRGREVLLLRKMFDDVIVDFHTIYFLSSIKQHCEEFSDNMKRVIIRLSVMMMEGISTLCSKVPEAPVPTTEQIKEHCLGSGTSRVHQGAAWTALAMYRKMFVTGVAAQMNQTIIRKGWLALDPHVAAAISHRVDILEPQFGLEENSVQEEEITMLSEDEKNRIEVELMWAWLNQVVWFNGSTKKAYDLTSYKEVQIDPCEMIDVQGLHREYGPKGFFGIYFNLTLRGEDRIISQITVLPRRCFQEAEKHFGLTFPKFISTTYPIHDVEG